MITSTANPNVKLVKSLLDKRSARRKHNLYVIEGPNLIDEAVMSGVALDKVFYSEEFIENEEGATIIKTALSTGAMALSVSDKIFNEMSDTQTPQGILATVPLTFKPIPDAPSFVLVIDRLTDPGNLGTVLRTAHAAGVELVILTSGTVDYTNPKVLRAAAGAHFRLPITQMSWEGISSRFSDHLILLADIGTNTPYHQIDWRQSIVLIVSEEANGPGAKAEKAAHTRITIPMSGDTESLNVAVAAGIMMFECVRQRS